MRCDDLSKAQERGKGPIGAKSARTISPITAGEDCTLEAGGLNKGTLQNCIGEVGLRVAA